MGNAWVGGREGLWATRQLSFLTRTVRTVRARRDVTNTRAHQLLVSLQTPRIYDECNDTAGSIVHYPLTVPPPPLPPHALSCPRRQASTGWRCSAAWRPGWTGSATCTARGRAHAHAHRTPSLCGVPWRPPVSGFVLAFLSSRGPLRLGADLRRWGGGAGYRLQLLRSL